MSVLPPKGKFEWNLNTLVQLVTLLTMLIGGVAIAVNNDRDISELQSWRKDHEAYHKDRALQLKDDARATNSRLLVIEADLRKIDNLDYRVTVLEQGRENLNKAIVDMQTTIQQLASDQRVSTEILKRLDATMAGRQR